MSTRREEAGAREALGEAFTRDLWASWEKHGADALEAVRTEKPDLYLKLVTAVLPKDLAIKAEPDDLDDAALDRKIASLAAGLGLAIRARRRPGGQGAAGGEE
jgi:hypothetical protein